jgi:hypothetical protein
MHGTRPARVTAPSGWEVNFRFARAASVHAIQHLGNEASLPTYTQIDEAHARFDKRREEPWLVVAQS